VASGQWGVLRPSAPRPGPPNVRAVVGRCVAVCGGALGCRRGKREACWRGKAFIYFVYLSPTSAPVLPPAGPLACADAQCGAMVP
jgi:hypothetical protein